MNVVDYMKYGITDGPPSLTDRFSAAKFVIVVSQSARWCNPDSLELEESLMRMEATLGYYVKPQEFSMMLFGDTPLHICAREIYPSIVAPNDPFDEMDFTTELRPIPSLSHNTDVWRKEWEGHQRRYQSLYRVGRWLEYAGSPHASEVVREIPAMRDTFRNNFSMLLGDFLKRPERIFSVFALFSPILMETFMTPLPRLSDVPFAEPGSLMVTVWQLSYAALGSVPVVSQCDDLVRFFPMYDPFAELEKEGTPHDENNRS